MIATDEDALICDLAETYNIYNYKSLPASLVATFAVGLRESSRTKMKKIGAKVSIETLILAIIADRVGQLIWGMSEDGSKGINRPPQILEILFGIETSSKNSDVLTFDSPESFETARLEIIGKGGK